MHLLLARHGETAWNGERRVQGWANSDLTQRGVAQAKALERRLSSFKLTAAYSSDLGRAVTTAEIVSSRHGVAVTPSKHFRELCWGDWEGMTAEEIEAQSPQLWRKFTHRGLEEGRETEADWETTTLIPGGETLADAHARFAAGLLKIVQTNRGADDWVLLVGHGGTLRLAFTQALGLRPTFVRRFHLDNASLSHILYVDGNHPIIQFVNDFSHYSTSSLHGSIAEAQ